MAKKLQLKRLVVPGIEMPQELRAMKEKIIDLAKTPQGLAALQKATDKMAQNPFKYWNEKH